MLNGILVESPTLPSPHEKISGFGSDDEDKIAFAAFLAVVLVVVGAIIF